MNKARVKAINESLIAIIITIMITILGTRSSHFPWAFEMAFCSRLFDRLNYSFQWFQSLKVFGQFGSRELAIAGLLTSAIGFQDLQQW